MSELSQLIAANNMDIPAGDLSMGTMSFSLRLPGQAKSLDDLRQLPLLHSPIGDGVVILSDVAHVRLALSEGTEDALVNGENAILGYMRKTSDANTVTVTERALAIFDQAEQKLPPGTKIRILEDGATFIKGTIFNLQRTVMTGGGLVALVVLVFLRRMGPTMIVACSIPASMIVTFLVVYGMGYTLNSVTLIAMSLSVGMVVDNGVVALENISRKMDDGLSPIDASYEGASEVGGALLASTTTSLVIFAPMIFISGIVGQMFAQLAVVMIVTVSASLFVALTLTPTMSARFIKKAVISDTPKVEWWEKLYVKILKKTVHNPWKTIFGASVIAVMTLVSLMFLNSDFLPKDDIGQLSFSVELPVSATKEESLRVGTIYANALRQQPEVEAVSLIVGTSNSGMGEKEGNNIAQVRARLSSPRDRNRSDQEIGEGVLAQVSRPSNVVSLEMSRDGSGAGALGATKPIVVEVLGSDLQQLQEAVRKVDLGMKEIAGTQNVVAELLQEKPEIQILLDKHRAKKQGILIANAGNELRMAMSGAVVSRYTGGTRPRDVFVRFQQEDRDELSAWRGVPVRSADGSLQTLGAIGEEGEGGSPVQIRRKDKARVLSVSTEISGRALTAVATDVEKMLSELDLGEGISTQIGGAIKDQRESFGDLNILMLMGLALVYLVMVAQFESWTDPVIIMFSVPFAATGAFLALLLTGTNLSVTSFLGLIILIGVVVNNAIVLIDYIKLQRRSGKTLLDAVFYAGQRRLRPVLITSLTTAGGMLPLALTTGEGEQLWGPMGKTALGGLLISSVITLILVPVLYIIVEKNKKDQKKI